MYLSIHIHAIGRYVPTYTIRIHQYIFIASISKGDFIVDRPFRTEILLTNRNARKIQKAFRRIIPAWISQMKQMRSYFTFNSLIAERSRENHVFVYRAANPLILSWRSLERKMKVYTFYTANGFSQKLCVGNNQQPNPV